MKLAFSILFLGSVALAQVPTDEGRVLYERGLLAAQRHDYLKAIPFFDEAFKKMEPDAAILFQAARIAYEGGNYTASRDYFSRLRKKKDSQFNQSADGKLSYQTEALLAEKEEVVRNLKNEIPSLVDCLDLEGVSNSYQALLMMVHNDPKEVKWISENQLATAEKLEDMGIEAFCDENLYQARRINRYASSLLAQSGLPSSGMDLNELLRKKLSDSLDEYWLIKLPEAASALATQRKGAQRQSILNEVEINSKNDPENPCAGKITLKETSTTTTYQGSDLKKGVSEEARCWLTYSFDLRDLSWSSSTTFKQGRGNSTPLSYSLKVNKEFKMDSMDRTTTVRTFDSTAENPALHTNETTTSINPSCEFVKVPYLTIYLNSEEAGKDFLQLLKSAQTLCLQ